MARSNSRKAGLGTLMQWRVEQIVFLLLVSGARLIPLSLTFRIGYGLGGLAYGFTRRYRQIVQRNLRIALFPESPSLTEIDTLSKRVFQLTGANLFSSIRTATLRADQLLKHVTVKNIDLVEKATADGKGCILLLAHMSNWELLAQLGQLLPEGCIPGTHYRPLNNPYINARIEAMRARQGTRLFAKRSSSHSIAEFLRNKGVLGILADQRAGNKAKAVSFFGRLTGFTPLPSLLAHRTGSPMLGLSVTTTGTAQWTLTFHPASKVSDPQATASHVEAILKDKLEDGFWFQDRWRVSPNQPFLPPEPKANSFPQTQTPFRILIWKESATDPEPNLGETRPDLLIHTAIFQPNVSLEDQLREWDEKHPAPIEVIVTGKPDSPIRPIAKAFGIRTHVIS